MATNRKRLGRGRVIPTDAKSLWDSGRHVEAMMINVFVAFADGRAATLREWRVYHRLVAEREAKRRGS